MTASTRSGVPTDDIAARRNSPAVVGIHGLAVLWLIVALATLLIFYALLLRGWWIALAGAIVLFIAISGWLWPRDITAEKEALS